MKSGEVLYDIDSQAAEQSFRVAAQFDTGNPWPHIFLTRLSLRANEYEEARSHISAGFDTLRPGNIRDRVVLLNERGKLAILLEEHEAALTAFTESLDLISQLAATTPNDSSIRDDEAVGTLNVSRALHNLGRHQEALDFAQRSLTQRRATLMIFQSPSRFGEVRAINPETAASMETAIGVAEADIAAIHRSLGQYEQARAGLERAESWYHRAQASGAPTRVALTNLGLSASSLAALAQDTEHPEIALSHFRDAARAFRALQVRDPGNAENNSNLAHALNGIASTQATIGDMEGATETYQEAVAFWETVCDPGDQLFWALVRLGDTEFTRDQITGATQAYGRAIDDVTARQRIGPQDPVDARNLWIAYLRRARLNQPGADSDWVDAHRILSDLAENGMLSEGDAEYLEETRRRIGPADPIP